LYIYICAWRTYTFNSINYFINFNVLQITAFSPGGRGGGRGGRGGNRGGRDSFGSRGGGRGGARGGRGGNRGGRSSNVGTFKGGKNVMIEPHRHEGVFIARGKEDALVTLSLVPGVGVYGEKRISVEVNVWSNNNLLLYPHVYFLFINNINNIN